MYERLRFADGDPLSYFRTEVGVLCINQGCCFFNWEGVSPREKKMKNLVSILLPLNQGPMMSTRSNVYAYIRKSLLMSYKFVEAIPRLVGE